MMFLGTNLKGISNKEAFTLVEVLVTVAIMTVVLLGFAQLTNNNIRAQRGVQDASDLNTFQNALQQIMSINSACSANLAGSYVPGNTLAGVSFNGAPAPTGPAYPTQMQYTSPTNPSQPIISEIDYPMPGPSPNTYVANTNNHLIQKGQSYGGWTVSNIGVQVQGVPGPSQYYITLEVDFTKKNGANGSPVSIGSPTGLRQTTALTVTTTSGSGSTVTVTGCGTGGGCPTGMSMIGAPFAIGSFCISTSVEPTPVTMAQEAATYCMNTYKTATLCSWSQFYLACNVAAQATPPLQGMGDWEWIGDLTGGVPGGSGQNTLVSAAGGGGCYNVVSYGNSGPEPYRCCLH